MRYRRPSSQLDFTSSPMIHLSCHQAENSLVEVCPCTIYQESLLVFNLLISRLAIHNPAPLTEFLYMLLFEKQGAAMISADLPVSLSLAAEDRESRTCVDLALRNRFV